MASHVARGILMPSSDLAGGVLILLMWGWALTLPTCDFRHLWRAAGIEQIWVANVTLS